MKFEELLDLDLYSLEQKEKEKYLTKRLRYLTEYHRKNCSSYQKILKSAKYDEKEIDSYTDLPFLPVRLFKDYVLKSVPDGEIIKTMTSSGTSGQRTSKIYLDRTTSVNQQKALVKIVSEFAGTSRMPMIIIDCPSVVKDRKMFSARGAGILGFSVFGTKKMYALDDNMQLNFSEIKEFLETHKDRKILLFGFTFMVWQHFYKELCRVANESGETIDLSNAVLIHGGGWKKLITEAVTPEEFRNKLHEICGLNAIHDYYGMVEQTGCIYMQCECGHLHASVFSDIIIRRPRDFSVADIGERGIIQVLSSIPESYPGHSLLTEDEGVILGKDDCPCGRKGKYFEVLGRLRDAELRGCSDTYATKYGGNIKQLPKNNENEKLVLQNTVLDKIDYLIGDVSTLQQMTYIKPLLAFDDKVLDFLNDLSKELMRNPVAKGYQDVISLGFWLRRSSLISLRKRFILSDKKVYVGRGMAFHIAPSNVPVNYAYSLFTGLITGNANVVRVPSKDYPQIRIINAAIKKILSRFPEMKQYICLIRYKKDDTINSVLSSLCDARIIWGGDATIAEFRRFPIHSRAVELTFADRYSLAIIDADSYMKKIENYAIRNRIAMDFYNDTYLTDQNACTSPKVIAWTGRCISEAKKAFWDSIYALIEKRYEFQPIMGVNKLCKKCEVSINEDEVGAIEYIHEYDNMLVRIQVEKCSSRLMNYRGNCGFFYEYDFKDANELYELCNNEHCQTVAMLGDSEIIESLITSGIKGVDRIIQVGHTMDFDLNWDGYNLVEWLTRTIALY